MPNLAGSSIEIIIGDITAQATDAIVNVPNGTLTPVGVVSSAIHSKGGTMVTNACQHIVQEQGALLPGQVVHTPAGNLAARYVIHAIGPAWYGGEEEAKILAACYRESLWMADELNLSSIAFPSIATGAGHYPVRDAAPIFWRVVQDEAPQLQHVRLIRMVCFDKQTFNAYNSAAPALVTEM